MSQSLSRLYTADEVRRLEQLYAQFHGGKTYSLMERAGAAAYFEMREEWPDLAKVLVVCGKGNNGGDGFVLARLAAQAGIDVTVALLEGADEPRGDAAKAFSRLDSNTIKLRPWTPQLLEGYDLIVDAILGTGIYGDVREPYANVIKSIAQSKKNVLAIDVPSGLNADTGSIQGCALKADLTVTFIGIKRGLLTGLSADYVGRIALNDLKCGHGVFSLVRPKVFQYGYKDGLEYLKPRRKTSHKGFNGHVLVIGGYPGFAGASRMSAEAALRSGAGLVSLLTHEQHANFVSMTCPEIMTHGIGESISLDRIRPLLKSATVIAIGPGLGKFPWGRQLLACVEDFFIEQQKSNHSMTPSVWDADALNLLAERPRQVDSRVITPHPGEAARLLDSSVTSVQNDRFLAVNKLAQKYGGVCLLKGPGTIVGFQEKTYVINAGNPGMASGGMGDVLTGIIAGLIAQGVPLKEAACLGAAIHGEAAEKAVCHEKKRLERGLLATDLFLYLKFLMNPFP